jgi:hypothetical protein
MLLVALLLIELRLLLLLLFLSVAPTLLHCPQLCVHGATN